MLTFLHNKYWRNRPIVSYWKTADAVEAKVVEMPEGHKVMFMKGEKYPFPGFPRGSLLYGKLSPLKHWIKNKVFNDVWAMLEDNRTSADIQKYLKEEAYPYVFNLGEQCKYDMVPPEKLVPAIKELYRALSVAGTSEVDQKWRDIITFILEEDDGYRNRVQWIVKFLPKFRKPTVNDFLKALAMLEHGEVVDDMKERVRLVVRVLSEIVKDPASRATFERFVSETDWNKVKLTEADKYFFRAKYFKCDYPEYKY